MTHYNDTIKTIKITTKLFNNQTQSLLESLQKNIDEIIIQTQIELINHIAEDYNINSKDLIKKYINKKKKKKNIIEDDELSIQLNEHNETLDNIILSSVNNNDINNTSEEIIYKKIKIKNIPYLLHPETNEIFDMNYELVGKKSDSKYLLKKLQ